MKKIKHLSIMLILTGVLSCINDDSEIDNLQNVQAQFCDNYAGAGAAIGICLMVYSYH